MTQPPEPDEDRDAPPAVWRAPAPPKPGSFGLVEGVPPSDSELRLSGPQATATRPRATHHTMFTLRQLLDAADPGITGMEITQAVGLMHGTVYPILSRLEKRGWVQSKWEDHAVARKAGRPRRRFYLLTEIGREEALKMLREERPRLDQLRWTTLKHIE